MIDELIQLFNEGKLQEAIKAGNQAAANNPRDLSIRLVLAQLVCFNGDWVRVEKITNQLRNLDSEQEHAPLIGLIDHLSIAELQRKSVWTEGLVPEFSQAPDEVTQKLLWAWNCRRGGEKESFRESVDWVLENANSMTINLDEQSHEGLRDLDDMTCTILEAFSIQGIYFWIPIPNIKTIEIRKPTRPIDHLWSRARITLADDTDLGVYLPGLYFHSFDEGVEDSIRLGRETRWVEGPDGFEIGQGRRIFAAGDAEFTLFDFEKVELKESE